ncbi:Intermediate filament protein, partial [Gonapodya sp. JEL0774]
SASAVPVGTVPTRTPTPTPTSDSLSRGTGAPLVSLWVECEQYARAYGDLVRDGEAGVGGQVQVQGRVEGLRRDARRVAREFGIVDVGWGGGGAGAAGGRAGRVKVSVSDGAREAIGRFVVGSGTDGVDGMVRIRDEVELVLGRVYDGFVGSEEYWGWVAMWHGLEARKRAMGEVVEGRCMVVQAVTARLNDVVRDTLADPSDSLLERDHADPDLSTSGVSDTLASSDTMDPDRTPLSLASSFPGPLTTSPDRSLLDDRRDPVQDVYDGLDRVLLQLQVVTTVLQSTVQSPPPGGVSELLESLEPPLVVRRWAEQVEVLKRLQVELGIQAGKLCVERDKIEAELMGGELVEVCFLGRFKAIVETSRKITGRAGKRIVYYDITLTRVDASTMSSGWTVTRRFSEFDKLNRSLEVVYRHVREFQFPKKGIKTLVKTKKTMDERRIMLGQYLQRCLADDRVCRSSELRAFLNRSRVAFATPKSRISLGSREYDGIPNIGRPCSTTILKWTLSLPYKRANELALHRKGIPSGYSQWSRKALEAVDSESDSDLDLSTEDLRKQDLQSSGQSIDREFQDKKVADSPPNSLQSFDYDGESSDWTGRLLEKALRTLFEQLDGGFPPEPSFRVLASQILKSDDICASLHGARLPRRLGFVNIQMSVPSSRDTSDSITGPALERQVISWITKKTRQAQCGAEENIWFEDLLKQLVNIHGNYRDGSSSKMEVRTRMVTAFPAFAIQLLGSAQVVAATAFAFDSLQDASLNAHLLYKLCDIVMESMSY